MKIVPAYCVVLLTFVALTLNAFADEKENPCAKSLLNLEPPPLIQEVKIHPEVPKEGDDIVVRAVIGNDAKKTSATTTNGWLHFSIDDGKTETVVEMQKTEEKDAEGFAVWTGKIPAQKTGTTVTYYVSAQDSNGNLSTETPGESTNVKFPPEEGKESGIKFSTPVPDEECPSTEGGLDILGFSVGYDEKNLYGKITMRDKITEGTISPFKVNLIGVGFMNSDEGGDSIKDALLLWFPFACRAFVCAYWGGDWYVIDERVKQTKQPVPDSESGANGIILEKTPYFKLHRAFLKVNTGSFLRVFVITTQYTNADDLIDSFKSLGQFDSPVQEILSAKSFLSRPVDATPHMYVYLRSHAYTVSK